MQIVQAEEKLLTGYRGMMGALEEKIGMIRQAEGGEILDIRYNALTKGIGSSLVTGAAQQNVDLIVLGTNGWTGLKKFNEGSKAEEIAHSATIPVLTIGPKVSRGPEFKRLLYITDFSVRAANAIPYAASLARKYGASLDVLHVNDPETGETPRQASGRMSTFGRDEIRGHGFGDVVGREGLLFGERTERILQYSADRNIDMIVMGQKCISPIRARIAAHLPGGVAYNLIVQAQCAVLTVPDSTQVLQRDVSERS